MEKEDVFLAPFQMPEALSSLVTPNMIRLRRPADECWEAAPADERGDVALVDCLSLSCTAALPPSAIPYTCNVPAIWTCSDGMALAIKPNVLAVVTRRTLGLDEAITMAYC